MYSCITCQVATIGSILKFESKWLMSGQTSCIASILNWRLSIKDNRLSWNRCLCQNLFNTLLNFLYHSIVTFDGYNNFVNIHLFLDILLSRFAVLARVYNAGRFCHAWYLMSYLRPSSPSVSLVWKRRLNSPSPQSPPPLPWIQSKPGLYHRSSSPSVSSVLSPGQGGLYRRPSSPSVSSVWIPNQPGLYRRPSSPSVSSVWIQSQPGLYWSTLYGTWYIAPDEWLFICSGDATQKQGYTLRNPKRIN